MKMKPLIDPSIPQLRAEIEGIKDPEVRMFNKCLLTFGARSVEFAGVNCNGEKAYGTVGAGHTWITDYRPKSLRDDERDDRTTQILSNPNMSAPQVLLLMNQPPKPIKAAVFKIPIAKKKQLEGEPIFYRTVALPLDKKYEPWTEEIYNFYQQRGNELLFPYNRKHFLDYLVQRGVYGNFVYPVERYTIRTVLGNLEVVPEGDGKLRSFKRVEKTGKVNQYDAKPAHPHSFKQHGLRHKRTKQLLDYYQIKETLALCAFIGWAPARGADVMISRYGDIYSNWGAYFENMLRPVQQY
jgi:hypothetical protein